MTTVLPVAEDTLPYASWIVLPDTSNLPVDDGEPMESAHHRKQMNLLCELFDQVLPRETSYVAGNMGLYYSTLQLKQNDFKAPDVFVVLDALGSHDRRAWVVWEEDGRTPNLVVELLSESTERNDRGAKMRIYERVLKVPNYILYDPKDFRVEAWHLVDGRYERRAPDARGHIAWPEANVTLGRCVGSYHGEPHTWLRVFDADGHLVPTDAERAEAEAQRAEAAEARVRELLAELARRGG
jgi:Uma2 family endonuclease